MPQINPPQKPRTVVITDVLGVDAITITNGALNVNATFSGSISGNSAAGPTGSPVPVAGDYVAFKDGSGNLVGVSAGNPLPVSATVTPAADPAEGVPGAAVPAQAIQIGGSDGTNLRTILTDASGQIKVLIQNTPSVAVNNFPATQPVSGSVSVSNLPATQPVSGTVAVSSVGGTVAVSATALPLPTGAATDATAANSQITPGTTAPTKISIIGGKTSDITPQYQPIPLTNSGAAVKTDGSATTQPVSGTVGVNNFPATQPVSGTVAVNNFPGTQPVSGTVAVSSVGGTVAVSAASLPLPTGAATDASVLNPQVTAGATVAPTKVSVIAGKTSDITPQYQPIPLTNSGVAVKTDGSATTQPVSGTVAVNNFPGTQPVSGTVAVSNFPVTQPVSGTVTANIGSSGSLALDASVTGLEVSQGSTTSGQKGMLIQAAVTTAAPAYTTAQTAPLSLTPVGNLRVDGSSVTQPVSGTIGVNNFPATQVISGTVTGNQGTPNTAANAWPAKITDGTNTAAVKAASTAAAATDPALVVAVSPNNSVAVTQATGTNLHTVVDAITPPTLTKGTQGATGFSVQELKDAGRNNCMFYTILPIVTTSSEALLSLTGFKSDAAVATTTTPAVVTATKKYRITNIAVTYVAIATAGSVRMSLRKKVGGVVAVTDPVMWSATVGGPAAVAGVSQTVEFAVDMEINAGDGIGVSQIGLSTTQVAAAVGFGSITIYGYEY